MDIVSIIEVIAASGVVGLSDQYLSLFLVGIAANLGLITVAEQVNFVGEPWFIAVILLAWLLTVPPSAVPSSVAPYFGTVVNMLSGPVSLVSGAVFALTSAGFITSVHPDFQIGMYLLSHDADWFKLGAYHTEDWAVLFGGASVAGALTLTRFIAKPGLSLITGTTHTISAPLFAGVENVLALILVPLVLLLQRLHPLLVVLLMVLLTVGLVILTVAAVRKMAAAGRGLDRLFHLMDRDPQAGVAVAAEVLVWGAGWLIMGQWARATVMLCFWVAMIAIAFSGVGLCIVIPAYLLIAPRTAVSLYHFVLRARPFVTPQS